jgi:uncharacterized protein with PhoU and TrkA domain
MTALNASHHLVESSSSTHREVALTCFLRLSLAPQALVFHERHLALATAEHLDDEMKHANMNLLAVYCRAAEEHDEDGAAEASVESYHQMMKAAKACQDVAQQVRPKDRASFDANRTNRAMRVIEIEMSSRGPIPPACL